MTDALTQRVRDEARTTAVCDALEDGLSLIVDWTRYDSVSVAETFIATLRGYGYIVSRHPEPKVEE